MSQHNSLEAQVIARAAKDAIFLVRNPKATIEQAFGVKLSPTITFQVHEETEVVPSDPAQTGTVASSRAIR